MEGKVLDVPQFISFVIKSAKQFVLYLAYNAPKYCLMRSALPYLFYLSEKTEILSLHKTLPTLGTMYPSDCLCGADPPVRSLNYEYLGLFVSWLLHLRVLVL